MQSLLIYIEQEPVKAQILSTITVNEDKLSEISELAENIKYLEPVLDSSNLDIYLKLQPSAEKALKSAASLHEKCSEMDKKITELLNTYSAYVCFFFFLSIQF